jgi:arylsulfatase A-like enzyme
MRPQTIGAAWLALTLAGLTCDASAAKPNIVVILADDQGWGDLSVNGNTNLSTPHIDSLAKDGAVIDRFYVCSVCAPTRAEFFTGRYHPRGGVRGVSTGLERLNTNEQTIAQVFKRAGYATGAFGKWHNGSQWPYHPNARGFDEYYGFTSGHWGEYFDPPLEQNGKSVRGKGYIVNDFTDRAITFIEKNRSQPFFCYLPLNSPHSPYAVPEENWKKFKDKSVALRARADQKEDLDVTRCVLAMCENIDENVGRVLQKLDELNLRENTIVIYFSDNGPESYRWNGGMKGRKDSLDEGGIRAPFLIRWPGKIKAGSRVKEIAGAIDLLPTLSTLAGISLKSDKPLDGKDISPLLLNSGQNWPDRMIFSHHRGRVSVRTQQYRLDGYGALFDIAADPGQENDIAKSRPDVARKLSEAIEKWVEELLPGGRDDRPFPVGYPEFPTTPLPARDGVPDGNVQRSSGAPNCSYFVNWRRPEDSVSWDIEVQTTGEYDVTIHYTCPEKDAGSNIQVSFGESKLTGRVIPGWDPPLYTNQDTIRRPASESHMKDFRPLQLGTIHLPKGRGRLIVRALSIPGETVMDLRLLTLTLKEK